MTTTSYKRVSYSSSVVWTLGVALVWIVAAVVRTDTTLHLGPLLVPIVAAVTARETDRPIGLTVVGIAVGAGVITLLSVTGNLSGPPFEPFTSVLVESFVVLAVGAVIGLVISAVGSRNDR